jgi:hypothetical protein|tara:strand:- start:2137 stop:2544 length:408 start_codon:yes stop_codon:yes gene_type:complete
MEEGRGLLKKIGATSAAGIMLLTSAGCVPPQPPFRPFPGRGVDAQEYSRDVAECQAWASSQYGARPQRTVEDGFMGALIFGLLGAGLGALAGDARIGGLAGASLGAVGGGMQGNAQAQRNYDLAYSDCLRKKGLY